MLRKVATLQTPLLAAIVPGNARAEHVGGGDGQSELIGSGDGGHGDQLCAGALGVGEVFLPIFTTVTTMRFQLTMGAEPQR